MRDLRTICDEINAAAGTHPIGRFQEIRRSIHGKGPKTNKIFTNQTGTIDGKWAFNLGGRKELQLNVGFESFEGDDKDWFRYGVAFSLDPSQTLPKPLILMPKILKLNQYLTNNASEFEDLRFWYYSDHKRSKTFPIGPIPDGVIRVNTFLFWGRLSPRDTVQTEEILFLFDRLLNLYRHVEGDEQIEKAHTNLQKGFVFKAGCMDKPESALGHSKETTKAIVLRHNSLQSALHKALCKQYGEVNVGTENDTGRGSRVDLVVRTKSDFEYYEIKTYPCIRTCLREGVSQLIEYSYWPGGNTAKRMVVVSENPLTPDAKRYLVTLRSDFNLPVYYRRLDMSTETLEELQ